MKYYYLLNGKIMWSYEKMPEINEKWQTYNANLLKWSESLQPCDISESEKAKVIHTILANNTSVNLSNPIDVTDIVEEIYCKCNCGESFIEFKKPSDNNGVITFKPKQVEEIEAVDSLLNTFGQFCTLNGIKLTDSNKVGQAVIDFKKSDIYQIFKNQK